MLLITGGPGQPGVPALARIPKILGAELHDYRVVVYDQRGTGAGALDCPALQSEMGSSDLWPPSAAAVRACSRQLGARRQFFGTDDVVADMESLRRALGVDRWTLDGISYGSYVGERYALAHPDRVQRLVLDSVVPHVGQTDLGVVEFRATARVLRSVCGTTCVADLAAVVRARHNGAQLLDALTLLSIIDPTYRTSFDVPRLLQEARGGNLTGLNSFLGDGSPLERDAGRGRSTRACTRALSVRTGGTRGARPRRRSPDARRSSAARSRSSRRRGSRRSTGRRPPARGSCGSACRGRRHRRRRSTGAS